MKTRNGFISNSSSSSFIVASKNPETKFKITIEVDLNDYADSKISTADELRKIFIEDYYMTEEEMKDDGYYNKCLKAIEDGKIILVGKFSDDNFNNPLEGFLCNNGIPKNCEEFEIIQNKPGY